MLFFINTNLKDKIYFILSNKKYEKTFYKEYNCDFMKSQDILSFLEDFIKKSGYKKQDFFNNTDAIVIDSGPGINMNFRIGIIIVNTISYLYNLNIVTLSKNEYNNTDELIKIGWDKFSKKGFTKLVVPEYSVK